MTTSTVPASMVTALCSVAEADMVRSGYGGWQDCDGTRRRLPGGQATDQARHSLPGRCRQGRTEKVRRKPSLRWQSGLGGVGGHDVGKGDAFGSVEGGPGDGFPDG